MDNICVSSPLTSSRIHEILPIFSSVMVRFHPLREVILKMLQFPGVTFCSVNPEEKVISHFLEVIIFCHCPDTQLD